MEIPTCHTPYGSFSYWPNDCIGQTIASGAFWDDHLRPAFDEVPPGSLVVDVGANIGWFTVYAAKRGCQVYAFEACFENFELLRMNVEKNGVEDHVSMFPLALYDRCQRLELIRAEESNPAQQRFIGGYLDTEQCHNSGGYALRPGNDPFRPQYSVPLDFFHLQKVALIKVDTEGSDLEILKGAERTIQDSQPILCYEYIGEIPEVNPTRMNQFTEFIREIDYDPQEVLIGIEGHYHDFIAKPRSKK